MPPSAIFPVLLAVGILAAAIASVEVGYRLGVRTSRREAPDNAHLGAVQGAILGLLGLLMGFSFAGASGRFVERQDLIVREANAIGTAYLRADLLDSPYRENLKSELRAYTDLRIEFFGTRSMEETHEVGRRSTEKHEPIWTAAVNGVRALPSATIAVLPPVNEVIDLHSVRIASNQRHLPGLVLGVLGLSASVALATVGYSGGLSKRRNAWLTTSLACLFATALWVTIDLDYPRRGMIRVSNQAMVDLRDSMGP